MHNDLYASMETALQLQQAAEAATRDAVAALQAFVEKRKIKARKLEASLLEEAPDETSEDMVGPT